MATKIPKSALSLKQFLKRQEVLKLYREIIRSIRKIEEPEDRNYFFKWTQEEFRKYQNETNEESIDYHITRAKKSLKDLCAALNLSK